jgi:hypothetical protein
MLLFVFIISISIVFIISISINSIHSVLFVFSKSCSQSVCHRSHVGFIVVVSKSGEIGQNEVVVGEIQKSLVHRVSCLIFELVGERVIVCGCEVIRCVICLIFIPYLWLSISINELFINISCPSENSEKYFFRLSIEGSSCVRKNIPLVH